MIKLLISDDSAFMRIAIRKMVGEGAEISVVGEAPNGQVAVQMARELRPDVITMDVEMPVMNGLDAVREIMASAPCPIIMVSSLTERDSATTIKALELGAVDFIAKQSSFVQLDIAKIGQELVEKLRFWGQRKRRVPLGGGAAAFRSLAAAPASAFDMPAAPPRLRRDSQQQAPGLVVVGISTGGPVTLPPFLKAMGELKCPVVIAQHMPPMFTAGLAAHLRIDTGLNVIESSDNLELKPGMVVIAKGGQDVVVRESAPGMLRLFERLNPEAPIHPNANVLFASATRVSCPVIGVVMTGMGSDGLQGSRELIDARGATILAQDPSTCVVDGMPGSVIGAGLATAILSPQDIGRRLARLAGQSMFGTSSSLA
jgi:two-component system chemotaxis response regulator CheB